MAYVFKPRNCYTRECSRCRRWKPLGGGKLRPVFVCRECRRVAA